MYKVFTAKTTTNPFLPTLPHLFAKRKVFGGVFQRSQIAICELAHF